MGCTKGIALGIFALVVIALAGAPAALTYEIFSLYGNGTSTTGPPTNNNLTASNPATTERTYDCSITAGTDQNCWDFASALSAENLCSQNGTSCPGGLVLPSGSVINYSGWFYETGNKNKFLNIQIVMVDGVGGETTICQSPQGAGGVQITSGGATGTQHTVPCTLAQDFFVPSGYKLKVYVYAYCDSARTATHYWAAGTRPARLDIAVARLGTLSMGMTTPATDQSIVNNAQLTQQCTLTLAGTSVQAVGVNVTSREMDFGGAWQNTPNSGANVIMNGSGTNPMVLGDVSIGSTTAFGLKGNSVSTNNQIACSMQSTYNQTSACSAAACRNAPSWGQTTSKNVNVTAGPSSVVIWDDTKPQGGSKTAYANHSVSFFANYTNAAGGAISSGACNITFDISGWTAPVAMAYNSSRSLYIMNRSFTAVGTYPYNVSCNASGYMNATNTSSITVNATPQPTACSLCNCWDKVITDFDAGTYNKTYYDTGAGGVSLQAGQYNGTFVSRIFDGGAVRVWDKIDWTDNNEILKNRSGPINTSEMGNWLPLEEIGPNQAPGGTDSQDMTGQGHHAVASNDSRITFNVPGKVNRAFYFNGQPGSNMYVLNVITGDFTLEFWMQTSVPSSTGTECYHGDGLIWADYGGTVENDVGVSFVNNKICFWTGNPDDSMMGTTNLNDGQWHYVVATRNMSAGRKYLYVDGVLQASGTTNTNPLTQNLTLSIAGNDYDRHYFNGKMDEITIWNKTVNSGTEIQRRYTEATLWLNMSVRSCSDATCAGGTTPWVQVSGPGNLNLTANQYFQYKFGMATDDLNFIPQLFNVTLSHTAKTNLSTWSDTMPKGGSLVKRVNDTVGFYVNYTDSNGASLGPEANCTVDFNIPIGTYGTLTWTGELPMAYNSSGALYNYNRSFADVGNFSYRVTCRRTCYADALGNGTFEIQAPVGPWILTDKPSYVNCGAMYYRIGTALENGTFVNTNVTVSITDANGVVQQNMSTQTGNGGTGFYNGNYTLPYDGAIGSWLIQAVTCGAFKSYPFSVSSP